MTEEQINDLLKQVRYPGYSRDIISFGLVKNVAVNNGAVSVMVELNGGNAEIAAQIKHDAEQILRNADGVEHVHVQVKVPQGASGSQSSTGGASNPFQNQQSVPGLQRIVAVASGKGGVGKSTVSVNLACGLQKLGARVGLLDCDIYGPSIPLMMGVRERPSITPDQKMVPVISHGIKLMSMGFLLDDDQPVIWRGPMIMKTIQQFFNSVDWGELDILLVDLPPGTGDAQLSLCQTVPLDGGVIVTTPQDIALIDAWKGIEMFRKVQVPVLGVVENMSTHVCGACGHEEPIFGQGGGDRLAAEYDVELLARLPLSLAVRESADSGQAMVMAQSDSTEARIFLKIADALVSNLGDASVPTSPTITMGDD